MDETRIYRTSDDDDDWTLRRRASSGRLAQSAVSHREIGVLVIGSGG